MELQKGQKVKLEETIINSNMSVNIDYNAGFNIDISCFGLDKNDKLSNEDYMIFYNQLASPNNEVKMSQNGNKTEFSIELNKLPESITKLVFTAAIDSTDVKAMNSLSSLSFKINDLTFDVTGADFNEEKAIIISEIYKKDNVWRLNAVGQGFKGGLDALLVNFGGQVASNVDTNAQTNTPTPPEPQIAEPIPQVPSKISLEKKFQDKAPALVSLAKKASISLEKNNLGNVKCKTAFVIDASGSMYTQYQNQQVQETLNRVFPLGVHFDDDDQLETWAFADKSKKLSNINFSNYKDYVEKENSGWKHWMSELNSSYNNEPAVIIDVIKHFTGLTPPTLAEFEKGTQTKKSGGLFGFGKKTEELKLDDTNPYAAQISDKTPIFIIFISDGGVSHNKHIEELIKWSSSLPIFWQFIGIGGTSYGALEKLDELSGRLIDNANFFSIDDLKQITEDQLYDRMINEFPKWLEAAHAKGIINDYKIDDSKKVRNRI